MVRLSRVAPLLLVASLALVWAACDSLSASGPASFSGTVLDDSSGDPIAGAVVSAEGFSETDTTDASGAFLLTIDADSTDQEVILNVSADGYDSVNLFLETDVDNTVELDAIRLEPLTTGGNTGTGASREPESITLFSRSSETIGVREAGSDETATLEFIVYDPSGRPINADNAVELSFAIGNGPGGGETLEPATASTGADGKADVTLTSGTRAGTVQVVATATIGDRTLRSQPVTVTITGGLPDAAHFSLGPEQFNIAGYSILGIQTTVTAYVGDKYGNPVQPGTAVYFTTDGGLIQGSSTTNDIGAAPTTLISALPRAQNTISCPGGTDPNGYTRITASTADENNDTVEASTIVLYSSDPTIEITSPASPALPLNTPFRYTVEDVFGHPLAPGTTISVVAGGTNVRASGDVNVELGDYLCPGPGRTTFAFTVSEDDDDSNEVPRLENVTITVTSPNGDARLTRPPAGASRLATPGDLFERLDK